jgi:hypothetical protein
MVLLYCGRVGRRLFCTDKIGIFKTLTRNSKGFFVFNCFYCFFKESILLYSGLIWMLSMKVNKELDLAWEFVTKTNINILDQVQNLWDFRIKQK